MIYRACIRPLLYLLPPELAHGLAMGALRVASRLPFRVALASALRRDRDSRLQVRALGCTFPTPIGLAAGFDKDAVAIDGLSALGFGFIEVGTVTGQGQPGNARPRLFRLPRDRALINRMGFNNAGAEQVSSRFAARLRRRAERGASGVPVGINIGKTKSIEAADAVADYQHSTCLLAPYADYLVVNVSSPNTPGLRDLQATAALRPLLQAVRRCADATVTTRRVPLLVKIAPDLDDDDVDGIADLALELQLDGIIATNTTIARSGLETAPSRVEACGAGGLSGAPLKARALEVLGRLRARVADRLVLISVGGIEDAGDAYRRIRAGATLVQVYTALVYDGPLLPRRLAAGVAHLATADGFATVADAIGADAADSFRPDAANQASPGDAELRAHGDPPSN